MLYNEPIRKVIDMKIEKIHLNKIKVTFTPDDLIEHNLSVSAVKDNSPWVQKVLMSVVRRAEEEVGFSAENARLMVEAMPAEGDGLVMYITRLGSEEDVKDALVDAKRRLRLKVKTLNEASKITLISFESFEDAIALARFATDCDEGYLYFHEGKYHLVTDATVAHRFSEFGKMTTDEKTCNLVCEHGKLICDNALKTLRNYF